MNKGAGPDQGKSPPDGLPPCLSADAKGLVSLALHVQPRASRNGVVGLHDGRLKVAITAPPVEGQANQQLITFLAKLFRVSKGAVTLETGSQGRGKRFTIAGITLTQAAEILAPWL